MKVILDACQQDGEFILFENEPLTGVAYEAGENGRIVGIQNVVRGKVIGPHSDFWGESRKRVLHTAISYCRDRDESLWLGEVFDGIRLTFRFGKLFTEEDLGQAIHDFDIEPFPVFESLAWLPDGSPLESQRSFCGGYTSWHAGGGLKSTSGDGICQELDQQGRCCYVDVQKSGRLSPDDLMTYRVSPEQLMLCGNINDQDLLPFSGLTEVNTLILSGTKLTPQGLRAFAPNTSLRLLSSNGNEFISENDLAELAKASPDCEVRHEE